MISTPLAAFENPSAVGSSLPHLISGDDGRLHLSWVTMEGDTAVFQHAAWNENRWTKTEQIARGTDWFVNWADYPMFTINKAGNRLAHYLAKSSEGTYSYDVHLTASDDEDSWLPAVIPHNDQTPTEHGFVTMLPDGAGSFTVAWLDGRRTAEEGPMTLRSAVVQADLQVSEHVELDDRVCDCCQTGGAMTENGPVFVYRNRSEVEWRDIFIVRKVDGQWTNPQVVYEDRWEIAGCPVNGPRISALGNEMVVAWYTAANGRPMVKAVFSSDGGATFSDPVILDNGQPLGRVDVAIIGPGKAAVSWLTGTGNDTATIKYRLIQPSDGQLLVEQEKDIVVAETSAARASGFPQMSFHNNHLYFAWTEVENDVKRIRMAKAAVDIK